MNYATANNKLGKRDRAKVARNTYLERRGDCIALKLHATDIATLYPSGALALNSGGWRTATTKDRLSSVVRIHQERGQWYVTVSGKVYTFRDGMTIGPRGGVNGAPLKGSGGDAKEAKMRTKVKAFADAWTDRLFSGKMEAPGAGDCFYCAMRTADGKSLGDATGDRSHLLLHVKERYYVPSLVHGIVDRISPVARGTVGYLFKLHPSAPGQWAMDIAREQVQKAMRRYLLQGCGFTPASPR